MKCWVKVLILFCCGLHGTGQAVEATKPYTESVITVGSIIEVPVGNLHPTQSVIAHDQVNYKLALYNQDRHHLFSDLCKNAGWGRKVDFNEHSLASEPHSYSCLNAGNEKRKINQLKTVVVGPNNELYLTDGHHTFSTFNDMPQGGPSLKVAVYVQANFSQLAPNAFWQNIESVGKAWLYNALGERIIYTDMPTAVGRKNLQNDPYRAALYFLRDGVWDKPKPAIEFVEFYWAQYLRQQPQLAFPGYRSAAQYIQWLERIHAHLLTLAPNSVILDGFSAKQLGWLGTADFARLSDFLCIREPNSSTLGAVGIALTQRGMPVECDERQYLSKTSLHTGLAMLPPAINGDGSVNVLLEISAGSNAKWQQDKTNPLHLEWEFKQGQPRQVKYLAYPTNYGIVTSTLLTKENGGDGDPLDVLVLGPALPQGTVQKVRLIGVMRMLDNGEQDDKILAVPLAGLFSDISDLPQLQSTYPGVTAQLQGWFEHYKGDDAEVKVSKFDNAAAAKALVACSLVDKPE
jgi:inorganic pyrophosphatase